MARFISWSMLNFSSIILAVSINIFFGLVRLINLLGIRFNYFYSSKVIDIVIFSSSADLWIWGASLLFVVLVMLLIKTLNRVDFPRWLIFLYILLFASFAVFLIDDRIASVVAVPLGFMVMGLSVHFGKGFLLAKEAEFALVASIGVMSLLIPIEFASLSSWIWNAFDYAVPFGSGLRWWFPWIDLQLFNVLYPLIPLLFLILLYGWIWIPAGRYVLSRIGRVKQSSIQGTELLNSKSLRLGLILSLVLSVFVTGYPYIHLSSSALVGVDSPEYYDRLKELMQKGPHTALDTDRPLSNWLMYFIKYVTACSPQDCVRIMPMIAAACLTLAVFWFVRVGTGDERLALLSSLFSSFSFQTTVSVFAYFLANWFAIIETFLLLALLLKGLKAQSWRYMLISALVGMAMLLTHPYTWTVLMVILISYLAWAFIRRCEERWSITPLSILLAANVLFYMFYTSMPFGKSLGESGAVLQMAASDVGVPSLLALQNGLGLMVSMEMGGLFGNPLLIILAIAGMFSLIDFTKPMTKFHRIVLLWVIIPSIALLAISSGQQFFYYRLVYLIPFQVLAAIGLHSLFNRLKDVECKYRLSATQSCMLRILFFVLVVLFLLNYSLRSVDEAVVYINSTP